MEDSSAILCQISRLKDMLDRVSPSRLRAPRVRLPPFPPPEFAIRDFGRKLETELNRGCASFEQVNEEIERSIQVTGETESEIAGCSEAEAALATREAELTASLHVSRFELIGLAAVAAESRKSVSSTEPELRSLRKTRDEIQERTTRKREGFIRQCLEFQRGIDQGESESERLQSLLAEKESLEKEIDIFTKRNYALQSSISTSLEEMVGDL